MKQILGNKAKTRRGKQFLSSLDPQLHEGPRTCAFLRGNKCSEGVQSLMQVLSLLKKKSGVSFSRKKLLRPMEDAQKLKVICHKTRCAFFCFG